MVMLFAQKSGQSNTTTGYNVNKEVWHLEEPIRAEPFAWMRRGESRRPPNWRAQEANFFSPLAPKSVFVVYSGSV